MRLLMRPFPAITIRFQIYNSGNDTLLHTAYVPVRYAFVPHYIDTVAFTPPSPDTLYTGEQVNLTYKYGTSKPGGVRIFPRPFTQGALTPAYAASGSGIHAAGRGGGSGNFTINSGNRLVDSVRFEVWNAANDTLLITTFAPVRFLFLGTFIDSVVLTPPSPDTTLKTGDTVKVAFKYGTDHSGGARILARPITDGALSTGYAASPSGLYPAGRGTGSGFFILRSAGEVDSVRFQFVNDTQDTVLFETFIPVRFRFQLPTGIASRSPGRMPKALKAGQTPVLLFRAPGSQGEARYNAPGRRAPARRLPEDKVVD